MKREAARAFVAKVESDPERLRRYENYRQTMMQINDAILDVAEDAGLLTAQDADNMRAAYPDYLPMLREHERGGFLDGIFGAVRGYGSSQGLKQVDKGFKKRSDDGSGRPVKSIVESTIQRMQTVTDRALRQQIHIAMVRQADPGFGGAEGLGRWF